MTSLPEPAADDMSAAEDPAPPSAAAQGPFVLNLCSSSTPMALAQTELPELKRFSFFVSRRFEEGRERFRLHMGYFATLAEAEEWLSVVREIYPGAWAGEAPGRKLRERAAAAAAAQAQHAAGPQVRVASALAPAPVRAAAPAPARPAAPPVLGPPPSVRVPVVHAAPPAAVRSAPPAAAAPAARPALKSAPAARVAAAAPVAHKAPAAVAAAPARPAAHPRAAAPAVRPPAPPAARPAVRPAAPVVARPAARPAAPVAARPVARPAAPARPPAAAAPPRVNAASRAPGRSALQDSNVREVLAALGETSATGETRLMKAPLPPRNPPGVDGTLSDTQVLRVLEDRRPDDGDRSAEAPASNIPLLKPDDTGTRQALKEAVVNNAPVWFAVQLQWSVQPVELAKVPPLAIFSAYTLYTVEGSRDGRHWYGLRLGFFSDAISAKQVAYYVRSEFGSVAVVPVSPQERARASNDEQAAAALAAPDAPRRAAPEEFKLIDSDGDAQLPARAPAAKPPARVAASGRTSASAARARIAGRVGARERRGGPTLEETLEILGATQLTIEGDSGETLNDTGVRHLQVEVRKEKDSPFSRLLERLSERARKP